MSIGSYGSCDGYGHRKRQRSTDSKRLCTGTSSREERCFASGKRARVSAVNFFFCLTNDTP